MLKNYHHGGDLDIHGRVDVMGDMTRFDAERLHQLISQPCPLYEFGAGAATFSTIGTRYKPKFRKVMPVEYRRAIEELARRTAARGGGMKDATMSRRVESARSASVQLGQRVGSERCMGKVHGLPRNRPARPALRAGLRPRSQLQGIRDPALRGSHAGPSGALHGLRHSVLSHTAARSTTRFPTGTTSSTAAIGRRLRATFIRPTISRNSPAAFARRLAKPLAR